MDCCIAMVTTVRRTRVTVCGHGLSCVNWIYIKFFCLKFVDVGTKLFYTALLLCKQKNPYNKEQCKVWRGTYEAYMCWSVTSCSVNITSVWKEQTVSTHSKTNVMHFLFSLLRIRGLYMFRAFRPWLEWNSSSTPTQPTDIIRTQYTKCRLFNASWGWASNARNM
jgi:hypothetical protein